MNWKHQAYAHLGFVRDKMTPAEIEAVQTFLGPLDVTMSAYVQEFLKSAAEVSAMAAAFEPGDAIPWSNPTIIHVNKDTHKITFKDEDEHSVTIVIEPN